MTPEQWRIVRDVFERALECPAGTDMQRWIEQEAGEPALAAEVTSLLRHHSQARAFLSAPALEQVPALLDADVPRFENGDVIGAYRIKAEIGRGGMGRVYLATDTTLGRDVALKVLASSLAGDSAQRERLRREARAAAQLSHPAICTIYALEEIGDEVVIAAEYVEGQSLRAEIAGGRRPSPDEVSRTARELAAALAAAHARGITHRDLKPENVMRTKDGSVKVLDFGLALLDPAVTGPDIPRVTTPGALIGTPAYMAPEQITQGVADARTDVFAFGLVVSEFATGVHPFAASSGVGLWARVLEGEPTPLAGSRADLPHQLVLVVERCLRRDQGDRFANGADLARALAQTANARVSQPAAVLWWRVHLMAVLGLYLLAAVAAWLVNEWQHGVANSAFALMAMLVTVGGVLRGHLLFAERAHEHAVFMKELLRAASPLLAVDLAIALILVVEGLWISQSRPIGGAVTSGLGLGIALTRVVLERSTTQAAFRARPDEAARTAD